MLISQCCQTSIPGYITRESQLAVSTSTMCHRQDSNPRQQLFHHYRRTNSCCLLPSKLLLLADATRSWRECDNYKQQIANAGHQTDMGRSEAVSSISGTASDQHAISHKRRDNRSLCSPRNKLC